MNNQTPFGFNPSFNQPPQPPCNCNMQVRRINERINQIERQINRIERRISIIENNTRTMPLPISNNQQEDYQNNYMI